MRNTIRCLTMSTFVGLAAAPHAWCAQESSTAAGVDLLDEVVVTSQKRQTNLQDVPFSVAAPSGEQIRAAGASNIVELARNVAGLVIADLGPGQSQPSIRGVSAGQVIRDQPGLKEQVGVYLDESPISIALFTPDLELVDLARMEVLRGPQGTLFGAGSEAGALRYITNQPKLGVVEGFTEVEFKSVQGGSNGGSVRGAVNLPVNAVTSVRVVGYYSHLPGFIDAIQPTGIRRDVNDGDKSGGRIALLFKPSDTLTIAPRLVYQKLKTNGFPRTDLYNLLANPYTTTQPPVTLGARQQYTQVGEGLTDDFRLADLKIDYDFGAATLTSVSTYIDRAVAVHRDGTSLLASVTYDFFPATPAQVRLSSPLDFYENMQQFSQEMRLASNGDSQLQWLVGGYYEHGDRRQRSALIAPGYDALTAQFGAGASADYNAPPDTPFIDDIPYSRRQYAVFGEATYKFTPQWSLTGGARYYNFKESRVLYGGGILYGALPPAPGGTSSNGVSPRLILSYHPSGDMQFNLQASRGFRLGSVNDPLLTSLCSAQDIATFGNKPNWRDEYLWNYELGAKLQFLDHRVTLNVATFYSDIKDLQATTTAGTCSGRIVFNVPKAKSQGVEAELSVRPNAAWDFSLSAALIDAKLSSSVVSQDAGGNAFVVGGLQSGKRLPTAPQTQAAASIGFKQPLSDEREWFANLTLQYVGSSYSQFENDTDNFGSIAPTAAGIPGAARLITFGDPNVSLISFDAQRQSYSLGNIRVGLRNERWEAAVFVNNIWDENASLALDYERGRSARVAELTNMPRTLGMNLRWNF